MSGMSPVTSITSLLSARQPGCSLPTELYTRPDVFAADMKVFFENTWICVGLECELGEPGDTDVVEIGSASIILIRDDDEQLRAFRNVCRHRGARILDPGPQVVGKLVCPYHQWTYETSGELIHAPHMGTDFDKGCKSLKPVAIRSIGGLIYICMSPDPPRDIDILQETMEPRLAPYGIRNARVAHQVDVIEKGNWKLTMENNRECYHCSSNHPELCVSFIDLDFGFDPAGMSEEARERARQHVESYAARTRAWEAEGHLSSAVERVGADVDTNFRTQRLAIANDGESHTMSGKAACGKMLGSMTRKDLGDTHLWGHNSWNHFMGDHAVVSYVIPLAPDSTLVRTKWLVSADAVEGVDYDIRELTEVWIETTRQDAALVERSHAGVQDSGYEPGPYSTYTEKELDNFATWYVRRLQSHGY